MNNLKNKLTSIYKNHKILFSSLIALLFLNYLILIILKLTPYRDLKDFQNKDYSIRYYDRNNILLQVSSIDDGLKREFTPLNEIPKDVKKAFLTAEDKRFYFHHGVDWLSAINAFIQNKQSNRTVRGASTITMQVVKMMYPEEKRTFSRKIKDVFYAYRIEAKLSKKEILELYLNSVPFGMNCEGITSATRTFYGKNLCDLSKGEICCLSVIPRRPSGYNPIQNPQECAQMAEKIYKKSFSSKDKNLQSTLLNNAKSASINEYPFLMPHYINHLQQYYKPSASNKKPVYEIHLAADLEIQQRAEGFLRQAIDKAQGSRISNGALLLLDNSDNSVLAWIGNSNFFDTDHNGQIDGVTVKNQPGSSMKPFLYALSIETEDDNGQPLYYPSKVIADIPKEFGNKKVYIPENFNNRFNGPIRFRIALASSLNVPAVTIINDIGVQNYIDRLEEMNFKSLAGKAEKLDLGLALGNGEVALSELVTAFSVFTRDGKFIPLRYTKAASPKEIEYSKQVYQTDTARLLCSILSDKAARSLGFGYAQTFQTDYPSIFKTGTANQYQDIVALGSTKQFTIGVWMGNFDGQTVMGKTGSSLPASVAKQVLDFVTTNTKEYKDNPESLDFPQPEEWTRRKICSLSGMEATSLCPATCMEYVKNGMYIGKCDWHYLEDKVEVSLPAEYQQWARYNSDYNNINYSSMSLEVLTPKNGTTFYYSKMNADKQAIPVELIGGFSDEAVIYYDGKLYKSLARPFKFVLPVETGNHTCKIVCGTEEQEFSFLVK